jgi:hypothetical protein
MKISECKGIRIHPALVKDKITYKVHYKDESLWINTKPELLAVIDQITMVQLFGDQYKTWQVGRDGWQKNSKNSKEE